MCHTNSCLHAMSPGKGSGLSFQELDDFNVITTSTPLIGEASPGNHYGAARSMLGNVEAHDNGMAPLLKDKKGKPLVFDPRDIFKGGNMVLWDDAKGGAYPWDENYFKAAYGNQTSKHFDPEVSSCPKFSSTSMILWLTFSSSFTVHFAARHRLGQLSLGLFHRS